MIDLLGIDGLVNKKTGEDFRDNLIKEYQYWFLLLAVDQRLLGRCYAWYRVPGDMQDLALLPTDHWIELQRVMRNWRIALQLLGTGITHPNYEWLGNEFDKHDGHGHSHLVPRYAYPFTLLGEYCVDVNFGPNGGTRHDAPIKDGNRLIKLEKRLLDPNNKKQFIGKLLEHFPSR